MYDVLIAKDLKLYETPESHASSFVRYIIHEMRNENSVARKFCSLVVLKVMGIFSFTCRTFFNFVTSVISWYILFSLAAPNDMKSPKSRIGGCSMISSLGNGTTSLPNVRVHISVKRR